MRRAKYTLYAINTLQTARWFKDSEIRAGWHRFVTLCRSLTESGFEFQVSVKPEGDHVVIGVIGTAGRAKAKQRTARKVSIIPAPVSVTKCRKMADDARRAAIRPEVVPFPHIGHSWHDTHFVIERKARDRREGRLIARAIARGEDTIPAERFHRDGYFRVFSPVNVHQILRERQEQRERRGTPKQRAQPGGDSGSPQVSTRGIQVLA
jgi:hypothetical protein